MNTIKITEDSLKIALNNVSGIEPAKSGSFTGLTPSTLVPFENSMYIDKRCHLEVMDTNHRYSKNLRAYYSLYKKINEKVSDIHTTSKCSGVGNFQENAEPTKPTIYQGKMWTGDDHVSLLGIDTDKTHSYALFFTWLNSPAVVEVRSMLWWHILGILIIVLIHTLGT